MAWSSFKIELGTFVDALGANATLKAFCQAKLKKIHTVKKFLTKKDLINKQKLPIIMVTLAGNTSTPEAGRLILRKYTFHLYCGFLNDNREIGMDLAIELEEEIEKAVLTFADDDDSLRVSFGGMVNDKGVAHPNYFFVKEVTIEKEQEI
ncbi:MAG: hypothetical protein KAS32_30465 [Candidatus Peribacteraceae bacterium]|nr:hypothetical protein [Candidatus Peribacteraceae bacterium]